MTWPVPMVHDTTGPGMLRGPGRSGRDHEPESRGREMDIDAPSPVKGELVGLDAVGEDRPAGLHLRPCRQRLARGQRAFKTEIWLPAAGKGSRTKNASRLSVGRGSGRGDRRSLAIERAQPVDPVPVVTIRPEEIWRSWVPAVLSR
jgi:hypothetical protein